MSKTAPGPFSKGTYREVKDARGITLCTLPNGQIERADADSALLAASFNMLAALEDIDSLFDFAESVPSGTSMAFMDTTALNAAFAKAKAAMRKAKGEP